MAIILETFKYLQNTCLLMHVKLIWGKTYPSENGKKLYAQLILPPKILTFLGNDSEAAAALIFNPKHNIKICSTDLPAMLEGMWSHRHTPSYHMDIPRGFIPFGLRCLGWSINQIFKLAIPNSAGSTLFSLDLESIPPKTKPPIIHILIATRLSLARH